MIGACSTIRNEQDIIGPCIRNLLEQGVDRILIADQSTDGTRDILQEFPEVAIFNATGEWHEQERWMNLLAGLLGETCEWIVPFDADEFWLGLDKLPTLDADIACAELWHHRDWEHKYLPAERLPKVAFRWHPDAVLAVGNHSVSLPPIHARSVRALEIRHYQYRSFEHFCRKVRDNSARLQQWELDRGDGVHQTAHAHKTDAELAALWAIHTSQEVAWDPIPCSR